MIRGEAVSREVGLLGPFAAAAAAAGVDFGAGGGGEWVVMPLGLVGVPFVRWWASSP